MPNNAMLVQHVQKWISISEQKKKIHKIIKIQEKADIKRSASKNRLEDNNEGNACRLCASGVS